jgi:hypothetical protein
VTSSIPGRPRLTPLSRSDLGPAELGTRYDDRQLIEAIFVVGLYQAVAGFLLTLGVQIEEDHELDSELAWPERDGEWNQSQ